MRRAELAVVALLVALGAPGCMKIYPDPELPDVDIEWYDGDCAEGTGDVSIVMTGVDDATERHEVTVPCLAAKTTFKDVSRQRFLIEGQLLDTSGGLYSASESGVDLRNGFDESTFLAFGSYENLHFSWVFDMGATCESLHADRVALLLAIDGQLYSSNEAPCYFGAMGISAPVGTFSATAYAYQLTSETVVAESQPIDPIVIDPGMRVDLGTVVLTPCAPCAQP